MVGHMMEHMQAGKDSDGHVPHDEAGPWPEALVGMTHVPRFVQ